MKTPIQRPGSFLLALGLWALSGCSHSQPYFRADSSPAAADNLADDTLLSRILLVGDAGEMSAIALAEVGLWAGRDPENTLVAFLGDNMYPEGMTPRRRNEADLRILPQIEAATGNDARALFVPGNHDWADGDESGYDAILAEAEYVTGHVPHEDSFLPLDGCPGPVSIDTFPGVRVVAVDTQWWLHRKTKPIDTCPAATPVEFTSELSRLVDTDRDVVIAAHHPLSGFGRHAGFSDWKEHLLIPVVGSIIALQRKLWPRDQDFASDAYRAMTGMFRSALERPSDDDRLLVWAAGHEHNLQVIEGQAVDYVLVSGSAAKTTPVSHGTGTLFAHSEPGFMLLDFLASGRVQLRVIEPGEGEVFTMWLRDGDASGN